MNLEQNINQDIMRKTQLLRLEISSLQSFYYYLFNLFTKSRCNRMWNLTPEIIGKVISIITFDSKEKSNPLFTFVNNSQKEEMLEICYKILEIFISINPILFQNNFISVILLTKFSNHFKYRVLKLALDNGFNPNSDPSFIHKLDEEDDVQYLTKILDNLIYKNFVFPDETIFLFKCEDNIKLLLDYSFIPNVINSDGENLLHLIYPNSKNFDILSTVKMLLHEGINPNFQNSLKGDTPLHLHLQYNILNLHPQFFEITKELISHGADLNSQNFEGECILSCLKNLTSFNRERLVNINKIVKFLVENGLNINLPDLACNVNANVLKILFECGLDPNLEDSDGKTILHHLFFEILEDYEIIKSLELLKKFGYDFNKVDRAENNILHYFFKYTTFTEQSTLFKLLFNYGAKLGDKNIEGKTPLHFINVNDMFQIFKFAINTKKYNLLDELLSFYKTEEFKNMLYIFEKYYESNDKRVVNKIKEYIKLRNRSSLVVLNRYICEDVIRYVINKYCYP